MLHTGRSGYEVHRILTTAWRVTRQGVTMAVQLNHTIVSVRDRRESANFLAEILGLEPVEMFGPVEADGGACAVAFEHGA